MATKKQAAATSTEVKVYRVISPLDHDGERFASGDEVELTDAQAAPLLGQVIVDENAAAAKVVAG